MSISGLNSIGELSLDFNQDMLVPDTININIYRSIIPFAI